MKGGANQALTVTMTGPVHLGQPAVMGQAWGTHPPQGQGRARCSDSLSEPPRVWGTRAQPPSWKSMAGWT